jgi:hypothetical protein
MTSDVEGFGNLPVAFDPVAVGVLGDSALDHALKRPTLAELTFYRNRSPGVIFRSVRTRSSPKIPDGLWSSRRHLAARLSRAGGHFLSARRTAEGGRLAFLIGI